MYSMVFIRFVNGYVDAFQSAKTAKSIAYLAVEKVGMPVWFVELRHTATHDYLPSLTILRSATHQVISQKKKKSLVRKRNVTMKTNEANFDCDRHWHGSTKITGCHSSCLYDWTRSQAKR